MDTAAEYLAEALACEQKAKDSTQDEEARALLLSIAARWRVMAESAVEQEAVRRPTSQTSLSA